MNFCAGNARDIADAIMAKKCREFEMEDSKLAREKSKEYENGKIEAWKAIENIEAVIQNQAGAGLHFASYNEGPWAWSGPKLAYLEGLSLIVLEELTTHGFEAVVNIVGTKNSGALSLDVKVGW